MTTLRPIDVRVDDDLAAYHTVDRELRREAWPDDPERSADELRRQVELLPSFVSERMWMAFDGDTPLGLARVRWRDGADNQDVGVVYAGVIPRARRRGLATQLVATAARSALDAGRTKLIVDSDSNAREGALVLERWGGKKALVARISRLELASLDASLMASWTSRGDALSDEFELLFWEDRVPSDLVDAFVELHDVMNSAPLEDLDVEPFVLTKEQLLAYEGMRAARGIGWWATVVRHRATGELAGFTDMSLQPSDRTILHQGNTGVWHKYRGKGLGRWLKARQLERVQRAVPEARWVQTGNAGSNRPMLNINEQMGFAPYKEVTAWQFGTEALLRRVERVSGS